MRGTRFQRALLDLADLACEHELESLITAAARLAARGLRAPSAWVEIANATGVHRRVHGDRDKHASVVEVTMRVAGRDCAIGVTRVEPFTDEERVRLALLARQLAIVATLILHDDPGVPLADEMRDLRRRRVARALERHAGNVAAAARALGVARSHVHKVRRSLRR